jgi:hypothetical protein
MRMFGKEPTSRAAGLPASRPVAVSNDAQRGRFTTLKVMRSPSRSDAVGLKTYQSPTVAVVDGAPEITGARFPVDCPAAVNANDRARGASAAASDLTSMSKIRCLFLRHDS